MKNAFRRFSYLLPLGSGRSLDFLEYSPEYPRNDRNNGIHNFWKIDFSDFMESMQRLKPRYYTTHYFSRLNEQIFPISRYLAVYIHVHRISSNLILFSYHLLGQKVTAFFFSFRANEKRIFRQKQNSINILTILIVSIFFDKRDSSKNDLISLSVVKFSKPILP